MVILALASLTWQGDGKHDTNVHLANFFATGDAPMLKSLFLLCAVVFATFATAQTNVLVILADDMGIDTLELYQPSSTDPLPITPNIDGLAATGITFNNAWVTPWCSSTRAALHTGRHGWRTKIGTRIMNAPYTFSMQPSETTMAEYLSGTNLATGAIGKWHLGTNAGGNDDAPRVIGGWQEFRGTNWAVESANLYWNWTKWINGVAYPNQTNYLVSEQSADAEDWILDQHAANKPWLCYLAFQAPYELYHAPPEDLLNTPLPYSNNVCKTTTSGAIKRACFNAAIEAMDSEIGNLLGALQAQGALNNTLIIFLGDNGTPTDVNTYWPANQVKGTIFEGGLRVPFIIAGTPVVDPGRTSDALVNTVDIFKTVVSAQGIPVMPSNVAEDSIDMMPLVNNTIADTDHRAINYMTSFEPNGYFVARTVHQEAARDMQYKLIRDCLNGLDLFYDLNADPREALPPLCSGGGCPGTLTPAERKVYDKLSAQLQCK